MILVPLDGMHVNHSHRSRQAECDFWHAAGLYRFLCFLDCFRSGLRIELGAAHETARGIFTQARSASGADLCFVTGNGFLAHTGENYTIEQKYVLQRHRAAIGAGIGACY